MSRAARDNSAGRRLRRRDPGRPSGGPRPRRVAGQRIAGWMAVIVVAGVTAGVLAGYEKYRTVWDSIGRVDVTGLGHRPPKYTSAENLLVFGSGSAAGLTRRQQLAGMSAGLTGMRSRRRS
jgi:hypothetical protein